MSDVFQATSNCEATGLPDTSALPEWHRAWISKDAHARALRAYLQAAGDAAPARIWEEIGLSIVRQVGEALAAIDEPLEIIQGAQLFASQEFTFGFYRLLALGGNGGRA